MIFVLLIKYILYKILELKRNPVIAWILNYVYLVETIKLNYIAATVWGSHIAGSFSFTSG
jgi:hypothetical protein